MFGSVSTYCGRPRHEGEVLVVPVQSVQIRHPAAAIEFGDELRELLGRESARKVLLDFSDNDYLSSTAFATLMNLARDLVSQGRELKISALHPDVLRGANIIGLGRVVDIHGDELSALDAFESPNRAGGPV
jgi:anti-anti-sigma factor